MDTIRSLRSSPRRWPVSGAVEGGWRRLSRTEVGKERNPPFLERGELSPELFQLAVDVRQFRSRLPFPEVLLTLPAPHEFLDLAAEQP